MIDWVPQAVKTQAPPTAVILLSAVFEKYLAFTTTGWLGSLPLPRTLKKPALVTSITGTCVKIVKRRVRHEGKTFNGIIEKKRREKRKEEWLLKKKILEKERV